MDYKKLESFCKKHNFNLLQILKTTAIKIDSLWGEITELHGLFRLSNLEFNQVLKQRPTETENEEIMVEVKA